MNETARKPSHVGFWLVIIFLVLMLTVSVLLNAGLAVGFAARGTARAARSSRGEGEDEFPRFTEQVSYGSGDTKVVRIPVAGVITRQSEDGLFGGRVDMVDSVIRQIRAATNDEDVKAILLEVDSPGGAITPTDEIYHALEQFRQSRDDRRVVAFVRDMAASGGYYVSMASDWVIAEPTALIGSISVLMQSLNWHTLSDKIGIEDTTIKSGANKDLLNPFRPVKPEQIAMLQSVVDAMHKQFVGVVKESRGLTDEEAARLTDGSVFSAQVASENGLIDQVGYWQDALDYTRDLLGVPEVRVVRYERSQRFVDLLAQLRNPVSLDSLVRLRPTRLQYLWQP